MCKLFSFKLSSTTIGSSSEVKVKITSSVKLSTQKAGGPPETFILIRNNWERDNEWIKRKVCVTFYSLLMGSNIKNYFTRKRGNCFVDT